MQKHTLMLTVAMAVAGLFAAGAAQADRYDRDRDHDRDRGGHDRDYRGDGGYRNRDYRSRRYGNDHRRDRDDNPPGWVGGPGTNWENPPGWRGGPGASPDYRNWRHDGRRYRFARVEYGYYYNDRYGYWHPRYGWWNQAKRCWWDNDDNPPGPRGGPGTNWENPPGWRGGPGASPDRFGSCR